MAFNTIEIDEETRDAWAKTPMPSINVVPEVQDDGTVILKCEDIVLDNAYSIAANPTNNDGALINDKVIASEIVKITKLPLITYQPYEKEREAIKAAKTFVSYKAPICSTIDDIAVQIEETKEVKERRPLMEKKKIKDMTTIELEDLCSKFDDCRRCPLLMNLFVEDDETYDYHKKIICYKKYANKIKLIENIDWEVHK